MELIKFNTQYTRDEKEFLRKNGLKFTAKQLSLALCRTEPSVRNFCKRQGIPFKRAYRQPQKQKIVWTQEEIDFIWDHAHEMTMSEMAKELGRSTPSIAWLAQKYGMRFKRFNQSNQPKRTLCQACKWCTGLKYRCPYVVSGLKKSVPGWKVQKVKMADYTALRVIECPLYEEG